MGKLRAFAAGAAGGLAGAALMGSTCAKVAKLASSSPPQGEDATEKVANVLAITLTGRRIRRSKKKIAGQIVHFAFGACMGGLYGLVADSFPKFAAAKGTLFGVAMYLGAHALTVPALGLAPSPSENGAAQEAPEFAAHIAYGLVTEKVRRALG
jgi:putative membrane protein